MYCLTEQQIEYILNDIRRNGVEMEDLQLNLLDHICCIVEQELKENDDFERFYHEKIKQFYRKDLHEIEEETISLLTFKNYYAMKKLMIMSGVLSATAFIVGSFFKIMLWEGAATLLIIGMVSFSFFFLPLLVLLKVRETTSKANKVILAMAAITGMLYCMSTMFIVMHIQGGTALLFATVGVSTFLLIPTYFFTGIRRPETRVNTIVTTVLIVAATGLMFTLMRVHQSLPMQTYTYFKNEQLLRKMQHSRSAQPVAANKMAEDINAYCEQIKSVILNTDIHQPVIPANADQSDIVINERNVNFPETSEEYKALTQLKTAIAAYNAAHPVAGEQIATSHTFLDVADKDLGRCSNFFVLNSLTQVQMSLLSNERGNEISMR